MPVPLSKQNFNAYGASTTPTLVVLNRAGQVAMYHPGALSYDELRAAVQKAAASLTGKNRSGKIESGENGSECMDRSALLGMTTARPFMFGFGVVWLLIGLFADVLRRPGCGFHFF
jgi:hypothetical protein